MNEITRIHIAKVAYDVEVAAKKQLEKYIKSLESYTRDSEVLADIEIRMTELLQERGVKPGGVITTDDVAAIREQLGEPYEFADEDGDIAVGTADSSSGRTFFRSVDDALLGGVLSGIAMYFKVDPMWTRLGFIFLLFISLGSAALAYVLLWIIVPPARTATEKLRQAGRPVTLESIRELNESEEGVTNNVAPVVKRTITMTVGIMSFLAALTTLALIIFAIFGLFGLNLTDISQRYGFANFDGSVAVTTWVVCGIVIAGLLLLGALFSLVAYASFTQKLTKRMVVSGVVIIALGLLSFVTSVGIVGTQTWRAANEAQSLLKTTRVTLPKEFSVVRAMTIESAHGERGPDFYLADPSIQYIVDEGAPRYELTALPGVKPVVKIDGDRGSISLTVPNDYRNTFVQSRLVIYGPALSVIDTRAANVGYTAVNQASLEIAAGDASNLSVNGGTIEQVKVTGVGSADLSSASVTVLIVTAQQGLDVRAGTVRELRVSQPDVCPAGSSAASGVYVGGVTSNKMLYNGTERSAETYRTNCAEVIIGDEYDDVY